MNKLRHNSCKHFCGFMPDHCEAGVRYLDLVGGVRDGMAIRLPCSGHFTAPESRAEHPDLIPVECPKFEKKTAEDIAKEEADIQRLIDRMKKIQPWVRQQKQSAPLDQHNEDACPICGKRIHFSIASYNGHMHARCETQGCINFME